MLDPEDARDVADDLREAAAEVDPEGAESMPNGVCLIADTPRTATPLATEAGDGDRALLREALDEHDFDFRDGSTVAERVFVVTDNYEPVVHTVAVDADYAEAEKERYGGIVHEASVDHTRVDFDEDFPDHLPHDLTEGDAVTYVRRHGEDKPASVVNVRPDGYIDLIYLDGDESREVHKVPPQHDGNDAGFVSTEDDAE
jgi:hypothetical protein